MALQMFEKWDGRISTNLLNKFLTEVSDFFPYCLLSNFQTLRVAEFSFQSSSLLYWRLSAILNNRLAIERSGSLECILWVQGEQVESKSEVQRGWNQAQILPSDPSIKIEIMIFLFIAGSTANWIGSWLIQLPPNHNSRVAHHAGGGEAAALRGVFGLNWDLASKLHSRTTVDIH